MRFNSLQQWLDWQQTLRPEEIELGLKRVAEVYRRLPRLARSTRVITVAGTNGKGSTVSYYEAWLLNNGYRVVSYTSPHLLRYNERIRLNGEEASDQQLCKAFDAIDQARENIGLTYFEFGTLAALWLASHEQPDFCLLEVGLGGRLDAVNIIDADLAHITPIGLDHQEWLGADRESIGYEKAGILRTGQQVVINDANPPQSLLSKAEDLDCDLSRLNEDYTYSVEKPGLLNWSDNDDKMQCRYAMPGPHQAANLSGVVKGLKVLGLLDQSSLKGSVLDFTAARVSGRMQQLESLLPCELWIDVGHNVDAAKALAVYFAEIKSGRRLVVLLGMLEDKDSEGFVEILADVVDEWWALGLECNRGLSADSLVHRINAKAEVRQQFDLAENVWSHALSSLNNNDILLVTGSFHTVEAFLRINS